MEIVDLDPLFWSPVIDITLLSSICGANPQPSSEWVAMVAVFPSSNSLLLLVLFLGWRVAPLFSDRSLDESVVLGICFKPWYGFLGSSSTFRTTLSLVFFFSIHPSVYLSISRTYSLLKQVQPEGGCTVVSSHTKSSTAFRRLTLKEAFCLVVRYEILAGRRTRSPEWPWGSLSDTPSFHPSS